jgi:hypothetical protein
MYKSSVIVFIICFCFCNVSAQKFLALTKPGINTRIRYYKGDKIGCKMKYDKHLIKGSIVGFTNNAIILNDSIVIPVQEIDALYDYEHRKVPKYLSGVFLSAAAVYGTVVLVNGTLANSGDLKNSNNAIAIGSMLGGGLILRPFSKRKYRLNEKRWLKIIDVSIAPQ